MRPLHEMSIACKGLRILKSPYYACFRTKREILIYKSFVYGPSLFVKSKNLVCHNLDKPQLWVNDYEKPREIKGYKAKVNKKRSTSTANASVFICF